MKLNEKNLAAFAVSKAPVDKEGWLCKRGDLNKSLQKRYFVLRGNLLFYFDRKGDKEPVGLIILEGCTIELAEEDEFYSFKIVFHGAGNRSYILSAETQESMEEWMKALSCAGYEYMSLMVSELERQLQELEENAMKLEEKIAKGDGAPVPPPRQRQNPFNRSRVTSSHSFNSGKSRFYDGGEERCELTIGKVNFTELHEEYGRQVLKHKGSWRAHTHSDMPLIQF